MNNYNPSQKIWKRFKRNRLALGGLIFILLLVIIGVLGYLITPDKTPYANTMRLQLNNKKPGRTFDFLIISKNKVKQVGFFDKMIYGQEAEYKSIPISSYRLAKNVVEVNKYIGDDEQPEKTIYSLTSLCAQCTQKQATARFA